MANTLAVAFDIDTPAAPVEISTNSGTTWAALTVPAAGNHKTANLLNVVAGTYAVGVIQLRGVGFPTSVVKNLAAVTIVDAATGTATQLAAPANTSAVASGATAMSVTASSVTYNNGYKLYRSTASAGTFAVVATIAPGNPPTVTDGGLTGSTAYFYQWQTLGNGTTYTDSALGAVFSGTTTAVAATAYPAEFFFMGDSKTANPGPGGTSWAVQMALDATNFPSAGFTGTGHIIAVSGECTDQQLARVPTQVIAARNAATYPQAIVWVTPGVNDLRLGEAGTPHAGLYRTKYQIAHDILEMGRQARLNGMKPILMTFGPDRRQYQAAPTEDTRMVSLMIDVNSITTANATKYGFVGVLDLTSDSRIGTASAPLPGYSQGVYWLTDLIHWNQAGEQYIAAKASTLTQQVASTALPAFTDPGEYVVPTAADTSTGSGVSAYTPYALVSPTFAEVVNATISGNNITGVGVPGRTPVQYWGSATSLNKASTTTNTVIAYVEQIANDNNKESLFGWNNNNTATDFTDLKFAWHLKTAAEAAAFPANGTAYGIRPFGYGDASLPNGSNQTGFIPYTPGDVLRVTLEQGRVVWYQNGIQQFAVTLATPPAEYFIDMALVPGGVVGDIRVGAANWIARPGVTAYAQLTSPSTARAAAAFKAGTNVAIAGNTITKTAGTAGTFDAGTTGTIALGASAASVLGSLDFVANKNGGNVLIGFHAGLDQAVDHLQLIATGAVAIQVANTATENGFRWFVNGAAPTAFIAYAEGDRIKMEIQQTIIAFYQNGTMLTTVAYALPVNSYIDTSLAELNTAITDVYLQAANPVAV